MFKPLRRTLMAAAVLAVIAPCEAASSDNDDVLKDFKTAYLPIRMAMPDDEADIIELFSFDCPYCYKSETFRKALLADMPKGASFKGYAVATMRAEWQMSAKLFRAAEVNGVEEKIHDPLFHYLHKDNKELKSEADLVQFTQKLGLPDLSRDFDSDRSRKLQLYIDGLFNSANSRRLPTFIVRGRYLVFWHEKLTPEKFVHLVHALYEDCMCSL